MKKFALIPMTVAALSVFAAPLALAQNTPLENNGSGYLSTRLNMDSPDAIARIVAGVDSQRQARGLDASDRDFLAGRENIDGIDRINAVYRQVAEDRALEGANLNPGRDYLTERRNLDTLEHINQVVSQARADVEQVGQL